MAKNAAQSGVDAVPSKYAIELFFDERQAFQEKINKPVNFACPPDTSGICRVKSLVNRMPYGFNHAVTFHQDWTQNTDWRANWHLINNGYRIVRYP
jgi:hypothetical protein